MSPLPPQLARSRMLVPYVVLVVSLLATMAGALYVAVSATAKDRARFENAVEKTQTSIQRRIETYVNLLHGGAGLFAAQKDISREQFRSYVARLELTERYPGIQGMGISACVAPEKLDEVIGRMRKAGIPDFAIRPSNVRDEYHTIIYIEPLNERNRRVIGYDMFTEPTRRAAMEQARDSGAAATSGKVKLLQETGPNPQAGFLIYVPIYNLGDIPATVELRRQLLAGYVYAPFRADDLLAGIFGNERFTSGILFSVYDGQTSAKEALLHRSDRLAPHAASDARFVNATLLSVPGRSWTVVYRSGPEFEINSSRSFTILILAAGGLVSMILFALTASQASAHRRTERVADELRRSEEALRISESRFRRLVDANLIGVVFSTIDGSVSDGNDEYFRIIGRSREEVRAGLVRWDHITPPGYEELDRQAVKQLMSQGISSPFEKEYIRADGSRVPVLVGVAMLEGSKTNTVALVVDLTERKAAERQILLAKEAAEESQTHAENANRLKDEFLATVSHELRTPLNAILGWVQLLRGGKSTPEEIDHGLETIERSARAQAQLIDDLLDVSRIIAGKLRLDMQAVQLEKVVEAAMASVRPAADAKGVHLIHRFDPQLGMVRGDPNRLQQVIWNLLSNAVKFTPKGGTVQVVLRQTDSHACITVSDSGIGIPPEFLPHVFERFRQADASTTRRYGGLGLGLGIVRHLVELHGGNVAAESPGNGKGATFTVMLPLAVASSGSHVSLTPIEGVSLDGVNILLVDDDADARELIALMLRERGARMAVAASATEAVQMFATVRPDVLISDIGMPEEDGYSLLRKIRAMPPEDGGLVPAIALTALARPEDRQLAFLTGFQVHLAKPVEAAKLATAVANLTDQGSARM